MFSKNTKEIIQEKITSVDNFIKEKLTVIPCDKLYHSFYGVVIFTIIAMFNPTLALGVVWITAFSKELLDMLSKESTASFWDIVYTVTLPTLLHMIIKGVI